MNKSQILLNNILQYIHENSSQPLSQAQTARHFNITPQYLGQLMKKHTKMTFCAYLKALRESSKKPFLTFTENINAEADGFSSFPKYWTALINLGYAGELRRLPMAEQLSVLQRNVHFTYGRICRITDLITRYNVDDEIIFDYSSAFSIFDTMLGHDILPFLEIGYKIFLIQESTMDTIFSEKEIEMPQYYDNLLKLLPAFLKACINRYGQSLVSRWRFEISYPYTGFSTSPNFRFPYYLEYFKKIALLIHAVLPECHVGGPGFNNWDSKEVLTNMLLSFKNSGFTPDFFSLYLYPIDKGRGQTFYISDNPGIIAERLEAFTEAARRIFPGAEIWVTEFNSNLSSRNYLNDMSYQAAFLVKSLLSTIRFHIQAMGYYILSDAPLRYLDSLSFLFGGWGLFTDTYLPKPSFHAYRLISQLGTAILKLTPDYIISKNSQGSLQLLTHRYVTPAYDGRFGNVTEDMLKKQLPIFEAALPVSFNFHFTKLLKGRYLIKEYRISETDSNLLSEWLHIDGLTPTRPEDLNDMLLLSALKPKLSAVSVSSDCTLDISGTLNSQEVLLILIEHYDTFMEAQQ